MSGRWKGDEKRGWMGGLGGGVKMYIKCSKSSKFKGDFVGVDSLTTFTKNLDVSDEPRLAATRFNSLIPQTQTNKVGYSGQYM